MVPKDGGQDIRYLDNLAVPHRIHMSPNLRRRHGPITRQPTASEAFRLACIKGDQVAVRHLIESMIKTGNGGRVSVNSVLEDGWTPLMIAASAARPIVLEYLLSKNADPNSVRKDNFTALMAATGSSQQRVEDTLCCVTALLKAGSLVNAKDNNGLTPLGFAVKENKREVAICLIEAGAKVDSLDRNGRNCLFYAAEKGYGRMARMLLENGANINVVDKNGWMSCEVAVEKGHFKLGELLFRVRESCWRPGRVPYLMTEFKDVPEPLETEPDTDTGEGIVNTLTNIQTQVKCLSNLVNSVRLRMSQDMITKEYEVEPGKMEELVIFARSMKKSCAILINEVCSLNILVDGETKRTHDPSLVDNVLTDSRQAILPSAYFPPEAPKRRKTVEVGTKESPSQKDASYRKIKKEKKEHVHNNNDDHPPPEKNIICNCREETDNYLSYKNSKKWDMLLAGAAGVVLLCFFAPNFKGRLGSMKLWQL